MPPVKSRREQYSDATKAALLEAATRRFAEHGFAGTSLEDVATDIQASRGAVYHHFANKTALFQAVFEELESAMIRDAGEASAGESDPWSATQAAMGKFLDHSSDPVYGRLVWQEAPIALGWKQWKACEEKYTYGLIQELLRNLMDSGALPRLPLEPMSRLTFHLMGAAGLAIAEAPEQDKPQVRTEYSQLLTRMLAGMRA